jgi:hypothetical protein
LIKNVGKSTEKKLNNINIRVVKDLLDLKQEILNATSIACQITLKKLNTIILNAREVVVEFNAPLPVDYRLAADPYLAKFGAEARMAEIKKSVFLSSNVCITEMVEHIYQQSELLFKGTINQNSWWFWHDALSLMTAKDTVLWMKEQGYYSKWLLPELDLYKDFPDVKKRYDGRPIGDTPEGMPLDNNLNQDLHTDVNRQVAATMVLDEDDERKFSTSTPNRLTTAYLKVWTLVGPTSKRIVEDVLKVIPSWEEIQQNNGGYVDKINRNGKRKAMASSALTSSSQKTQQGGARKRILPEREYGDARLHPDAQTVLDERIAKL